MNSHEGLKGQETEGREIAGNIKEMIPVAEPRGEWGTSPPTFSQGSSLRFVQI